MDDFTFFPATTTMTPAEKLPPAAVPSSGPPSSSAPCRKLPFFRFVPAAPPPSPAPPAEPTSRATGVIMAEDQEPRPPEKSAGPGAGGDAAAAKAAEVEDRMDQLWEDFNEELGQLARARARRRPCGGSWRDRRDDGLLAMEGSRTRTWSEPSPSPPSDAESEPAARAGCAPVLRPSARAAAGARHCRRRAGTWVLLMRIFRRLFVIEKTISEAAVARQRSSTRAR
ncbi:vasodilator-stimulated phosphoprotein-like [Setaria italica]|nr:vasodilator-stimulated phosphoprotein-like [Setaria italica]